MALQYAFCSYSFHRLLAAGKQDIFQYIIDSKELGACQLDPWNAHLSTLRDGDDVLKAGSDPQHAKLAPAEMEYLKPVKDAAEEAGLPWGIIAVDGGHIYEDTAAGRQANAAVARKWLDIAEFLGAPQMRVDAGGPEDMPDDAYAAIVEGYNDLIACARDKGVEILTENHWGPTRNPDHTIKLLENIEGLGLLFDTNNWIPERREEAWERCAKYARGTHVKTFAFDETGMDPTMDVARAINLAIDGGFDGVWGIESCPKEIDEYAGARQTVELLRLVIEG